MSTKTAAQSITSPSAIAATEPEVDPIAALITAHAPTTTAELLRPLPKPSDAAMEDRVRRVRQARHNVEGTPRGLIPVSGIRCGEYL